MPERTYTAEQLSAICHRSGNLLVSAGAGSGKTAVLVERVIRMIGGSADGGDTAAPVGIDRLLIVTFTTAAAAEMRERIAAALSARLEATEPARHRQAAHLRRQLVLLDCAAISTIHAFCLSVIKENLHMIDGLDPGFRLMDEAEASLLRADALDDVLEERYAGDESGAFAALVESYGMGRDDRELARIIQRVYAFSRSAPWPDEWLGDMTALFDMRTESEFCASVWAERAAALTAEGLDALLAVLGYHRDALLACMKDDAERAAALGMIGRLAAIRAMCVRAEYPADGASRAAQREGGPRAVPVDWGALRGAVLALGDMACLCPAAPHRRAAARKPAAASESGAAAVSPDGLRLVLDIVKKAVREFLSDIVNAYFRLDIADVLDEFSGSHALLAELSDTVRAYARRYAELKRGRSVVDFSDLEHFAIGILVARDPDTGAPIPTEAARAYRDKYAEVLIDEYQDSNLVQEYILRAVSGRRVFMVGDVKQSVYRFRQAMPELFMEKYRAYRTLDSQSDAARGHKILLYRNFRSDPRILNFVNLLFSAVMSERAGELDYTQEEWLLPPVAGAANGGGNEDGGAKTAEAPDGDVEPRVEIHVIDKAPPQTGGAAPADGETASDGGTEIAGPSPQSVGYSRNDVGGNEGGGEPIYGDGAPDDAPADDSSADTSSADGGIGMSAEDADDVALEARLVAQKIAELMAGPPIRGRDGGSRPVAYRDIAVLMRAVNGTAPAFAAELSRLGVPAYTEAGASYFETYEITVMLSLLKLIDNPLQDIPLLTVMLSPICAFTPEEAALIRHAAAPPAGPSDGGEIANPSPQTVGYVRIDGVNQVRDGENEMADALTSEAESHTPLYDCVCEAAARLDQPGPEPDAAMAAASAKARRLTEALSGWRALAAERPVSALIWSLMYDTDFFMHACAMPGGEQRRANLLQLFDYAAAYEKISYKGIFNFIRFVDRMIARGDDFAEAKLVGEGADGVRIMSIHKSKGLEFPIVFVAGCARRFNLRDAGERILLHRTDGFGPDYVDPERRIVDDTLAKKLLRARIRVELISEEMRILYVALTRARDRLYLVGTVRDAGVFTRKLTEQLAPYIGDAPGNTAKLPPEFTLRAGNYLFWVLSALSLHGGAERTAETRGYPVFHHKAYALPSVPGPAAVSAANTAPGGAPSPDSPDSLDAGGRADLAARLSWRYPHGRLARIPRKVSVTEISEARTEARRYADREEPLFATERAAFFGDQAGMADAARTDSLAVPAYMSGAKGFTRAEIGTYTHLVLEKADFARDSDPDALDRLIDRLVAAGQLLPEQAAAVDRGAIRGFLASEAGRLAAGARRLNRETVFTVKLSLGEYDALTLTPPPSADVPSAEPLPADAPFVLLQGSIDCWFETDGGELVLIDYKTGFAAGRDIADAERSKYRRQIELYALALRKMTGRGPDRKFICLLSSGECVELA